MGPAQERHEKDFWDAKQTIRRYEPITGGFEGMKQGRKRSIPERVWGDALRLYSQGHGYGMVASRLADLGVWTSRGSVERLIKGRPPYQGRRNQFGRWGLILYRLSELVARCALGKDKTGFSRVVS